MSDPKSFLKYVPLRNVRIDLDRVKVADVPDMNAVIMTALQVC